MQSQIMRFALTMLVLSCLAGCGGVTESRPNNPTGGSGSRSSPEFLFASLPGNNSIADFQIDTGTGALTPIAGSPFSATGKTPMGLAVHPSGRFLYGVNFTTPHPDSSGGISTYSIAPDGALSPVGGEVFVGSGIEPFAVAVDPTGKYVYTAAALASAPAGYTVDINSGALTPMSTTIGDFQDRFGAGDLAVINGLVYESANPGIVAFKIGSNGELTTLAWPAFTPANGGGVGSIAIGPGNKFIFGLTTGGDLRGFEGPPPPTEVVSVAINNDGTLTPAGTPILLDKASNLTVSGNFLFAVNAQGVWVFRIDSNTGAITLANNAPFVINGRGGLLTVDSSGKFLYVGTNSDPSQAKPAGGIAGFLIDPASGTLTAVPGSPFSLPEPPGGLTTSAGASH